jgi:hypothetical protein
VLGNVRAISPPPRNDWPPAQRIGIQKMTADVVRRYVPRSVQDRPDARALPAGSGRHAWSCGFTVISVIALAAALAAQAAVPDLLARAGTAIAIIGIVVGIPHGAVDHMVPFWLADTPPTPRPLLKAVLRYLTVAAAATGAFLLLPTVTVSVFLLASALHFGRGEVVFAAQRAGRPIPPWQRERIVVLAYGTAVVVLPLAVWRKPPRCSP